MGICRTMTAYNAIGDITNRCGTLLSYGNSMHSSGVSQPGFTGNKLETLLLAIISLAGFSESVCRW